MRAYKTLVYLILYNKKMVQFEGRKCFVNYAVNAGATLTLLGTSAKVSIVSRTYRSQTYQELRLTPLSGILNHEKCFMVE